MSMDPSQLGLGAAPGAQDTISPVNSPQDPETATPQELQQLMNPQNTLDLQDIVSQFPQNQGLPQYDKTIQAILNVIENACNAGDSSLKLDVQAKAINEMCAACHYLSQAAQQEGEHIPASIQVRLQAAQLDMQMKKQAQDMALAHSQHTFDQQQSQQMQNHQIALQMAKQHHDMALAQQNQQQQQQQSAEQHQAQLHQQANDMLLAQQGQQHDQQMAEEQAAQQAQQSQNQGGNGE